MGTMIRFQLTGILALSLALSAVAIAQNAGPVVDPYPGATMLPAGSIATIVQPPAINSRIGPGATPRGVAFPVAGQLLQGAKYRATQSAPPTTSPSCSRGWVQVFSLETGQSVVGANRDVWICKGDASTTYAMVSLETTSSSATTPQGAAPPSSSSSSSPSSSAQRDTIPPTTPVAIVVGAAGANTLNLNWNPATDSGGSGLAGYKIERCTGQNCRDFREIATPARPPYADDGLSPATTYAYRIRAYDHAGNHGEYTAIALGATQPAAAMLPDLVITELKAPATGVIGGQISVSATAANKGATATGAYRLAYYFSTDQSVTTFSGTYCEMAPLAAGATWPCSGTVAIPTTLEAGTYWLVAFADDLGHVSEKDKNNNTGAVRIALSAAPAQPSASLPSPSALTAALAGNGSIRLSWKASGIANGPSASGYRVERCAGSGCTAFAQIATPASTVHTDSGLQPGTTYSYRVRAFDGAGNSSNYSNSVSVTTTSTAVFGGGSN